MYAPFGLEQTLVPALALAFLSIPIVAVVLFWAGDWTARRWLLPRRSPGALAGAQS